MKNLSDVEVYRNVLRKKYLPVAEFKESGVGTGGVHHLALISSDLQAITEFYTTILQMRLVEVMANRDEATSTHIFLDMGGGNMLAFFDFPSMEKSGQLAGSGVCIMLHLRLTRGNLRS